MFNKLDEIRLEASYMVTFKSVAAVDRGEVDEGQL